MKAFLKRHTQAGQAVEVRDLEVQAVLEDYNILLLELRILAILISSS